MIRTIIIIKDDRVWKALKHYADLKNMKLSEALEEILAYYLTDLIEAGDKVGKE